MHKMTAVLMLVASLPAYAQQQLNSTDVLSSFALRDSFRQRNATRLSLFGAERVAPPPVEFTFTTGAGYSDAGHGVRTTSLPQELEMDLQGGATVLLFDVEYDWVRAPSADISGVGDPSISIVQRLWRSGPDTLSLLAGVTVPSGSDVSAFTAGQTLKMLWGHNFDTDRMKLSVRLDHTNDSIPGVSEYATSTKFYYEHDFPDISDSLDLFANVTYSYQSGAGDVWVGGGGLDFPIYNAAFGPFKGATGTLLASCVLSGNHHCGRVELDIVLAFR